MPEGTVVIPVIEHCSVGDRIASASEVLGLISMGIIKVRTDGNMGLIVSPQEVKLPIPLIHDLQSDYGTFAAAEVLGLVAAGLVDLDNNGTMRLIGKVRDGSIIQVLKTHYKETPLEEDEVPDIELSKSIEGLYSINELTNLYRHAKSVPDGTNVLEIGVFSGKTASALFTLARKKKLVPYLIDAWQGSGKYEYPLFTRMVQENFIDVPHVLISSRSQECAHMIGDQKFSFIHIDGSHEYKDVKADIEIWLPKLTVGGIVTFHDYYGFNVSLGGQGFRNEEKVTGVREAVDEYCTPDKWEALGVVESQASYRRVA